MTAYNESFNNYFYHFDGIGWKLVWKDNLPSLSDSVFFGAPMAAWGATGDDSIWISGLFLGRMKIDGSGRVVPVCSVTPYGIYAISGSAMNDVFFVGMEGAILHYNGISIKRYDQFYGRAWRLKKVFVSPNDVFIVGEIYGAEKGIILHGRRKQSMFLLHGTSRKSFCEKQ